ncbi:MAG: TonB-dependent receptor [Pseudomonadota bacterium]
MVRSGEGSAAGRVIWKEHLGPLAAQRLRNERKLLMRLEGIEGVIQLAHGAREADVLVLHDCGGISLAKALGAGRLDIDRVLALACELARTLAGIHRAGVIHRDINPANILLCTSGQAVLIDFDLAVIAGQEVAVEPNSQIVGTLSYMAPEQTGRTGHAVDQRADLYALGATLYDMATGRPPFEQADALELIHDHLVREPVAPWQVDARVPRGLSDIIVHLLAKAPEHRYKAPAVNHNATNPKVPLIVRAEIPTMLEAGLKNLFLDGRLGVNLSAYAMKIKDYQATIWDPAAVAFIFTNAPKLSNRGVTLNFYGTPTNALTVNGGVAYTVAKLGAGFLVECAMGSPAGCTRDAGGDQAGGAPKVRATLAMDYRFPLASMRGSIGGDVVYASEKIYDRTDPARNLPATTIVGARFGVRSADDKVGLTLYARNLFDKFNPTYRSGNLVAFATGDTRSYMQFVGPESRRVLGVSLDAKF